MSAKTFLGILICICAVYLANFHVDIMDVDAAQYASMSREMLESGSFLQIYEQGKDYLDKPPLLFWLSSASMGLFGTTDFGYKFPSILFAFLAIYATFRFAKLFYNTTISQLSALVLASSQAFFLFTNDIRTDTILTGCVAFAIWQFATAFSLPPSARQWRYFLGGFVGVGLGLLAKGPIALLVPAMAFTTHFLLKKEFKNFFRFEYLWGLLVIALILVPMCIGLYQQFDLHPEKVLYGRTGTSGLRFFFWTQSFGRITGENVWNNGAGFGFLFQNMLWAFLPWTFLFIGGYIWVLKNLVKPSQTVENPEFISLGAFTLGYLSMAVSKYQLPHYLFVVYPFAAVLTARFIYHIFYENKNAGVSRFFRTLQWFVISICWLLPFAVLVFVFPSHWLVWAAAVVGTLGYIFLSLKKKDVVLSSFYTILAVNIFLGQYFYPALLTFQFGSVVGKVVHERGIPAHRFFAFGIEPSPSLHFYAQRIVKEKTIGEILAGDFILTQNASLEQLKKAYKFDIVQEGAFFNVTVLTPKRLNYKTRPEEVRTYFLLKILQPLPPVE
jgi:4-amino-4-deoxy-L-arabinose transferase-like glycosyltransferase